MRARTHLAQALVETDGDVIEENNRAVGLTVVRGRPQILHLEKDPPGVRFREHARGRQGPADELTARDLSSVRRLVHRCSCGIAAHAPG